MKRIFVPRMIPMMFVLFALKGCGDIDHKCAELVPFTVETINQEELDSQINEQCQRVG